jgi:S-adenosylmethionine-diacylgycerolhomoserine-N-methlytransferase
VTGVSVEGHAGLLDQIYRRQRHIYDLSRKYYLLGRDRLIDGLAPPPGGRVLEIGCGTARNLIAVAQRHPKTPLYGIDLSLEMLDTARRRISREGLDSRVGLAHADATRFDPALLFGVPGFSRIFFSYTLSMIPEWEKALAQSVLWLQPGGELHLVDFGGQERLPRWFRGGLRSWLSMFHVVPRDTLETALARLPAALEVRTFDRPHLGYAQYAVCRRLTA